MRHHSKTKPAYRTYSTLLLTVTFCLVTTVVTVTNYLRHQDFIAYHQDIARSAVGELSHAIEDIVIERQRLVQLFADYHYPLLKSITQDPENISLQEDLASEIKRMFPDYFAFTLTNDKGVPLIDDFDGYIGELCLSDVQNFASSGNNTIRVHPNAFVYHFDVMAKWADANYILLISFPAMNITSLLRTSEAPGHELVIFLPEAENLIEITTQGSRDSTPQEDYRMTDSMRTRLLTSKAIEHTHWVLGDMTAEGFVSDFRRGLIMQTVLLLVLFGSFCLILGWAMRRNDALRGSAERTKDEFVSIISHELRTPLTSIQGSLALIQGGICNDIGEQGRKMLAIAINNTERLRLLVDDLLDLRKIESGKLELHLEITDIMKLVHMSLEQNQGYATRCGIRLAIREAVEGVMVEADPLRIAQVLSNLLSNAAKFSPSGAQVEISVHQSDANTVEVAVHDNGPGIDPQFHSKLFEKFTQADSSDSRRVNGTGLGLAISKTLIEEHNGSIFFESQVSQGSTFGFRLPIASPTSD